MARNPIKPSRKKKLGNYPHTMVIFSITLALFVIGLFGMLLIHASQLSNLVKENIEVQVYLDRNLSETQLAALQKTLAKKEFIAYKGKEAQVRFLSKEQGAKEFIQETGEDFLTFLGENPLRDAFILKINPEFSESKQLKVIQQELQDLPGVFEVDYVASLIDSINKNLRMLSVILLSFAGILVLAAVILINNTVKLALYSQRFLIRSMQLVGATSFFIQRPFLNRATVQGIISGLLAGFFLLVLLQYAYYQINELYVLRDDFKIAMLLLGLVILGCVLGFFSSYRAVRKYLNMSLDELY